MRQAVLSTWYERHRIVFLSNLPTYVSRACLDKPSLSSSERCTQQSRLRAQPPLPATVSRSVSASAGEELVETSYVWQNYFTKQEYNTSAGGIHITEETPLDTFPLTRYHCVVVHSPSAIDVHCGAEFGLKSFNAVRRERIFGHKVTEK